LHPPPPCANCANATKGYVKSKAEMSMTLSDLEDDDDDDVDDDDDDE